MRQRDRSFVSSPWRINQRFRRENRTFAAANRDAGVKTGDSWLTSELVNILPDQRYNAVMNSNQGQIIIKAGINVWPHELKSAEALAAAGYTVEFIRRSEEKRATSADILISGEVWEMKAPQSDKISAIEKNVRRALHQSRCVVYDSRRMKRIQDKTIEKELRKSAASLKSLKHLLFINRTGTVIDIK